VDSEMIFFLGLSLFKGITVMDDTIYGSLADIGKCEYPFAS
jgi:hypothetical protein